MVHREADIWDWQGFPLLSLSLLQTVSVFLCKHIDQPLNSNSSQLAIELISFLLYKRLSLCPLCLFAAQSSIKVNRVLN